MGRPPQAIAAACRCLARWAALLHPQGKGGEDGPWHVPEAHPRVAGRAALLGRANLMARIGYHGIVGNTRRVLLYVRAFSHNRAVST